MLVLLVAAMLGGWFVPAFPIFGVKSPAVRIASVLGALVIALAGVFATRSLASRDDDLLTAAEEEGNRLARLQRRAATDPAARVEYATYLRTMLAGLRTQSRRRGMLRRISPDVFALAIRNLEQQIAALECSDTLAFPRNQGLRIPNHPPLPR